MKKFALILTIFILVFTLASCGKSLPKEGVFYCEEESMSIDFTKLSSGIVECVKRHNDDGLSFYFYRCEIDGDRITISSKSGGPFISGGYTFSGDEFIITEDGGEFSLKFLRQE